MLYDFVMTNRVAIIARSREKLSARVGAPASAHELVFGVPLFLVQLSDTLRSALPGPPTADSAIGSTAKRHGRDLLALGFTVSEVVHDYGDICQSVTELAIEQDAPITIDEFKVLNGCLDTAIAEAVTEHARLTADARSRDESERAGDAAHDSRDLIQTAILAYHAVKGGNVPINGSTGAVLGRSLASLRDLADSALALRHMDSDQPLRKRVAVARLLRELADASVLHAESRELSFTLEPVDPGWAVSGDPQLLASAVMNVLSNAFKYTRQGGRVVLRARTNDATRILIEVEDECGGAGVNDGDHFLSYSQREEHDRTGMGPGLAIAHKAAVAHGGALYVRHVPGTGCIFTIDMPLVVENLVASATVEP